MGYEIKKIITSVTQLSIEVEFDPGGVGIVRLPVESTKDEILEKLDLIEAGYLSDNSESKSKLEKTYKDLIGYKKE